MNLRTLFKREDPHDTAQDLQLLRPRLFMPHLIFRQH